MRRSVRWQPAQERECGRPIWRMHPLRMRTKHRALRGAQPEREMRGAREDEHGPWLDIRCVERTTRSALCNKQPYRDNWLTSPIRRSWCCFAARLRRWPGDLDRRVRACEGIEFCRPPTRELSHRRLLAMGEIVQLHSVRGGRRSLGVFGCAGCVGVEHASWSVSADGQEQLYSPQAGGSSSWYP